MEIRTIEDIMKEIVDNYNRKPIGWQIMSDLKGNSVVLGPSQGYMLKTMAISPEENLGVGANIGGADEFRGVLGNGAPFGFRPLDSDFSKKILEAINAREGTGQGNMLAKVLSIDPVPTWELEQNRPAMVIGGPYLGHPDLRLISKRQTELDEKLSFELDKRFRVKYPFRASMYR